MNGVKQPMANPKSTHKRSDRLARRLLFEGVLTSLAQSGDLAEEDLHDSERLESLVRGSLHNLHLGADYREEMLTQAAKYWAADQYELSYVLYATFFEHSINFIIINRIARKLPPGSKIELIRALALPAKFGWLLELAELPLFSYKHRVQILQIAERRNAFIHFKWPTQPIFVEESKASQHERAAERQRILAAVKYMKSYSAKVVARGMASKISRAVARSQKNA
jgi:hypothetical protein